MKRKIMDNSVCRSLLAVVLLFALSLFGSACDSDPTGDRRVELPDVPAVNRVSLDKTLHRMESGERVTIVPSFSGETVEEQTFKWTSSDEAVATVFPNPDKSVVVTAVSAGTTIIEIASEQDGMLAAQCVLTVLPGPVDDGIVRILAIGNSFSEDAVEQYLWNLADAEGIETVVANMYIGGCSLATHVANAVGDKAAYSYRKVVDGVKTTTADVKLSAALADEKWDYISLQQVSGYSGIYSSFQPSLAELAGYVREHAANRKMKLILHQTWAYATNSGHADFAKYDKNQMTMYRAIADAYGKAAEAIGAELTVPSGTAVQNGRTSYLGDTFCRDGYHLERTYGRYTAACTWFESIFDRDVTRNTYRPESVSGHIAEVARAAAHRAVLRPDAVTELTEYKVNPEEDQLPYGIYVDFGSSLSAAPWNNIASVGITGPVELADSKGVSAGIRIQCTKAFGGVNTNGPQATHTVMSMPASASSDSFWGNTGTAFQGKTTGETELTVTGLDATKNYEFAFFSSRGNSTDNRSTQFTVKGATSETLVVDAASNTDKVAVTRPFAPDANGTIVVSLTSGPDNNNKNGFFYINAMRICPVR